MLLGSSSRLVGLGTQLATLARSPSHQDTQVFDFISRVEQQTFKSNQVVCSNGSRCFPSLLLGLAIPGLAAVPRYIYIAATLSTPCKKSSRFNSEVEVTLLLPHHTLGEVEKLLGLEETRVAEKEPEKEEGGQKKPRKLKQFTLQQQVEILDELLATGGNKYRQVKMKMKSQSQNEKSKVKIEKSK